MSSPQQQKDNDPRIGHLTDVIATLWEDMDANPSVDFEAQVVVDALDQWDRDNGVQRVSADYLAKLQADLSTARSALQAAVWAFTQTLVAYDAAGAEISSKCVAYVPSSTVLAWNRVANGEPS